MAIGVTKQTNIVANEARNLIFFEGQELCYNHKTDQWSHLTAYNTIGMYSLNSKFSDIGLVRISSGSVDLQSQLTSFTVTSTAIVETGDNDWNQGGRAVVEGVRPLVIGGLATVRVGYRDSLSLAAGTATPVTYSTVTSVNSRSGMANFRGAEGKYLRAEITLVDFTTLMGADVELAAQGKV